MLIKQVQEGYKLKRVLVSFVLAVAIFVLSMGNMVVASEYAHPESVISAAQLQESLNDKDLRVIDMRSNIRYRLGHVPGAVNLSIGACVDKESEYAYICPTLPNFKQTLGNTGISSSDTVVIYDDKGGVVAARLWWILKRYGHDDVRILDGGFGAWNSAGFETELVSANIETVEYIADGKDDSIIASFDEVRSSLDDGNSVVIDTRSAAEYKGEKAGKGAKRAGTIPGSVWIEWTQVLNEDKTFKSVEELKELYQSRGITPDKTIYTLCLGGYRAANTLFVLTEILGYENVRNYDGAWAEWSSRDDAPISKGK